MPKIPDSATIRSVAAPNAPSVDAPVQAFGGGIGDALQGLGAQGMEIADRSLSMQEADANLYALDQYDQETRDDYLKTLNEQDFSSPAVRQAFADRAVERRTKALESTGGRGRSRAWLDQQMLQRQSGYVGQASASGVIARNERVQRQVEDFSGRLANRVAEDPGYIPTALEQFDQFMTGVDPALPPEKQAEMRAERQSQIVSSAIEGPLGYGDADSAAKMLSVYSPLMTPKDVAGYQAQIREMNAEQTKFERQIAVIERVYGPLSHEQIGQLAGLQNPGQEPLVEVYDETSPSGARFVPRSQAVGMAAPVKKPLVDMGTQVGTIPQGFQAIKDPGTGALRMEPIPGGPTDIEAQRALIREQAAKEDDATQRRIMVRDLDRAIDLIGQGAGGAHATVTALIPGTDSYQLDRTLDGIKARVGFDALQKMRDNSPTGGALGQVSERENTLLQSLLGSLDIRQDPDVLKENLATIRELQLDALYGSHAEIEAAIAEGKLTEEQAAKLARDRNTVGLAQVAGGDQSGDAAAATPASAEGAPSSDKDVPVVRTKEDYDGLPPGSRYRIEGEGSIRREKAGGGQGQRPVGTTPEGVPMYAIPPKAGADGV